MRRLLPNSLAGQLILLLLLGLVAAQVASLLILADERRLALQTLRRDQVLERTAAAVRLLRVTPPASHAEVLAATGSPRLRFALSQAPLARSGDSRIERVMARNLDRLLDDPAGGTRLTLREVSRDGAWPGARGAPRRPWRRPVLRLEASVPLADGGWLLTRARLVPPPPLWALPSLLSMAVAAVALVLIVVLVARRLTRPLARLAEAAERLGRGAPIDPLPLSGPEDLRRTTRAFNEMQARLQRFLQDRTQLLAALSHDLRTPITSLRLRAELLDDAEARDRILETLAELEQMSEATLDFARESAQREDSRRVDLVALLASLCDDLRDLGAEVTFAGDGRLPLRCRPVALKRALRNLIENAVTHGGRARVALTDAPAEVRVTIDDDGPGIPADRLEQVFAPFVRLDGARGGATGGVGLGLSIARTVVREHGGDIALANRPEGGLRVTVTLPAAAATDRPG